jgi:hypothetical protein
VGHRTNYFWYILGDNFSTHFWNIAIYMFWGTLLPIFPVWGVLKIVSQLSPGTAAVLT